MRKLMTGIVSFLLLAAQLLADPPYYPAALVKDGQGRLVIAEKGLRRIAVYSPDGQKLELSYPTCEPPTGVAVSQERLYVTSFETKRLLRILNLDDGKEIFVENKTVFAEMVHNKW